CKIWSLKQLREHTLSLSLKEAVKGELESLFFDKVIANLGLCISVYDIESIYGGFIFANESAPTYTVYIHNDDNDLRARVLTKTEDIPDITTTARALLWENTDIIWEMLDKALGKVDGNQDILAKLLNDFYVIDMKNDPETLLLAGRVFLATANAVIDCRKAKIAVGEGITRSVFRVKRVDLGEEEAPYWTTLGKRESYKPRPSSDGIGAQTPYYARKDFLDCHLPKE
ncbi:MAK10-like protein, partial [Tanacetum coccineum]